MLQLILKNTFRKFEMEQTDVSEESTALIIP